MCSQNLVRNSPNVNQGPYSTIRDFVLASCQKELAYHSLYPASTALSDDNPGKPRQWKKYAVDLMEQLSKRKFSRESRFHLAHGDLIEGNNITLRGGKVTAIIDWETAAFLPFSEAVGDLLPDIEATLTEDGEIQKFMKPNDLRKIGRLVISHCSWKSHE